jgi:dimethylargininase
METRNLRAITRQPSPAISRCELTHLAREPIDYPRAVAQHDAYVEALIALGLAIAHLPPEPELPDAVFVEDTAVVVDELAVITRPGADSRRAEVTAVEAALQRWRPIARIAAPGTLDGGDVLQLGRHLYVGLSSRSNAEGARQLGQLLAPFGYRVESVSVAGCLHLKSAVSVIGDALLLLNPAWCDRRVFGELTCVEIDPSEPFAANVLRIDESVILAEAHPGTAARLRALGLEVRPVDVSELAKAEGGVTCCSLVLSGC